MIEEVPIVDTEESAAVVTEPIVVKKRGRPKGAPNKPKVLPKPPLPKKQPAPPSDSESPVPVKVKKKRTLPPPHPRTRSRHPGSRGGRGLAPSRPPPSWTLARWPARSYNSSPIDRSTRPLHDERSTEVGFQRIKKKEKETEWLKSKHEA